MKRDEQIISEAKKYYCDDINCHNAFLHGVEWADEHPVNVWHEASEMPKDGEWILIQFDEDSSTVIDGEKVESTDLAANDGLSFADWYDWFRNVDIIQPMAIIHFTNYRYGCKQ